MQVVLECEMPVGFFSFFGGRKKRRKNSASTLHRVMPSEQGITLHMIGSDPTHARFTPGNALLGVYSASSFSTGFTLVTHWEAGHILLYICAS
jgi:hypothetical protein